MRNDDEFERGKAARSRSRQTSQRRSAEDVRGNERRQERQRYEKREEPLRYQKQINREAQGKPLDASMGQRVRNTSAYREASAARDSGQERTRRPASSPDGAYQSSSSRGRKSSKKPTNSKRKVRIAIIVAEVLVLIGILVFAAYSFLKSKVDLIQRLPFNTDTVENLDLTSEKKEQMKGYWTIAIFGVDDRGTVIGKGTNADVNIVCNINQDTGEIKMVSVFRDSYLNISDKNTYNKINQAYFLGGPEQAVKALNKNLDLNITDYVTFNWKAVADAINILGGVDLEISKNEFYYINAFITETVKATGIYSTHLTHAGMNHLDGVQAVAYGRLRLMDTDYARTERQRKIIELAFEKAKKADWATLNNIIETVFPQVATSIETKEVVDSAWNITKYHIGETGGFPFARGDARMGKKGACVIPQTLESNVIQLHEFLFGDTGYTTTEMVKTISKKIAADTGMYKEGKAAEKADTDKGYIPKETKVPVAESKQHESTAEETTEEQETTLYPGQTTAPAGPGNRPGAETTRPYETDANGNVIIPPGATRPSSPSAPTTAPATGPSGTTGTTAAPGNTPTYSPTAPANPSTPTTSPNVNRPGGGNTTPTTAAVPGQPSTSGPGGNTGNSTPPTTAPGGNISFQGPGGQ